ncbi:hypothetical protein ACOMHN_011899 [Nucella lapillus]
MCGVPACPSASRCKQYIQGSQGSILSPNFPGGYPINSDCQWTIEGPLGSNIFLERVEVDLAPGDYIHVGDGSDASGPLLAKYSGNTGPLYILSTTPYLYVLMKTGRNTNVHNRGFVFNYMSGCPVPIFTQKTVHSPSGSLYDFGDAFNVTCPVGYVFDALEFYTDPGNGTLVSVDEVRMECLLGGVWNVRRYPQCVRQGCPKLSSSIVGGRGRLVEGDGVEAGSVYGFDCDSGYMLFGSPILHCNSTGLWSHPVPACQRNACPTPSSIPNGYQIGKWTQYNYGDTVTFSCLHGYHLSGEVKLECWVNGTWSADLPTCNDVEPPKFADCPSGPIRLSRFSSAGFKVPTALDNSGSVSTVIVTPSYFYPTQPVADDTTVNYTAVDHAGLTAECIISIVMIVLGPILFLIFINDLPDQLKSKARLFADDCIVYHTVSTTADSEVIQQDLNTLADWERCWGMEFHPMKCNVLSCTKSRKPHSYDYQLKGHVLARLTTAKYLGVDISSDLSWKHYIDRSAKKANNMLGFLKRNLKTPDRTTKCNAYFALVRPHLEYCSSVWNPHTANLTKKIEAVKRRAARYVTSDYNPTSKSAPVQFNMVIELQYEATPSEALTDSCQQSYNTSLLIVLRNSAITLKQICSSQTTIMAIAYNEGSLEYFYNNGTQQLTQRFSLLFKSQEDKNNELQYTQCFDNVRSALLSMATGTGTLTSWRSFSPAGCPSVAVNGTQPATTARRSCTSQYKQREVSGITVCLPCPPGTSKSSSGACELCGVGQYWVTAVSPQYGQCVDCSRGRSTVGEGSIREELCIERCDGNFVSPTGVPPCNECDGNSFAINSSYCQQCPSNTQALRKENPLHPDCNKCFCAPECSPGYYSITGYQPDCLPCPVGFFSPTPAATYCQQCPPGNTTQSQAATSCLTNAGFRGERCEENINNCFPGACNDRGTCIDGINGFTCDCVDNYSGSRCELQGQNGCDVFPCGNNSVCRPTNNYHRVCDCFPGYTGPHCDSEITGKQKEEEKYNYIQSENVDDCLSKPCFHGAMCVDQVNGYRCDCLEGWAGARCETVLDLCSNTSCQSGGNCSTLFNDFACRCPWGLFGTYCEVVPGSAQCSNNNPCVNTADCVLNTTRAVCDCQNDIDEDYDMCFSPFLTPAGAALPYALPVSGLGGFTLMVWVRFGRSGSSGTFLSVYTMGLWVVLGGLQDAQSSQKNFEGCVSGVDFLSYGLDFTVDLPQLQQQPSRYQGDLLRWAEFDDYGNTWFARPSTARLVNCVTNPSEPLCVDKSRGSLFQQGSTTVVYVAENQDKNIAVCSFPVFVGEICPAGQYFRGSSCALCAKSSYQDLVGQFKCKPCPRGFLTLGKGSTSITSCAGNCSAGFFIQSDKQGVDTCAQCPRDQYNPVPYQRNCTACPKGTATRQPGADMESLCEADCPAGKELNLTTNVCDQCARGYYRDKSVASQTQCVLCPLDFITDTTGSTSASNCNVDPSKVASDTEIIVGTVIGVVGLFLILILIIIGVVVRRKRMRSSQDKDSVSTSNSQSHAPSNIIMRINTQDICSFKTDQRSNRSYDPAFYSSSEADRDIPSLAYDIVTYNCRHTRRPASCPSPPVHTRTQKIKHARTRCHNPCQRSVGRGNTSTPSMHQ